MVSYIYVQIIAALIPVVIAYLYQCIHKSDRFTNGYLVHLDIVSFDLPY